MSSNKILLLVCMLSFLACTNSFAKDKTALKAEAQKLITIGTSFDLLTGSYVNTSDSAVAILKNASNISKANNFTELYYISTLSLSRYFAFTAFKYDSAHKYVDVSIKIAYILNDSNKIYESHLVKASYLARLLKSNEADLHFSIAMDIAQSKADFNKIYKTLLTKGALLGNSPGNQDLKSQSQKLVTYYEQQADSASLCYAYFRMGQAWAYEKPELAARNFEKSLVLNKFVNYDDFTASIYINLAGAYSRQEKNALKQECINKLLQLKMQGNPELYGEVLIFYALNERLQGINISKSILDTILLGKNLIENSQNHRYLGRAYTAMALYYEKMQEEDSAKYYHNKSKATTDSLGVLSDLEIREKGEYLIELGNVARKYRLEQAKSNQMKKAKNYIGFALVLSFLSALIILLLYRAKNSEYKNIQVKLKEAEESVSTQKSLLKSQNGDAPLLHKILQETKEMDDLSSLNVSALAGLFHISERQFRRNLKKETDMTPVLLINEIKLSRAKEMITKNSQVTVKALAMELGYENTGYFSKLFEKKYNIRPAELIKGS
jgi:AraC-like DNA-binding protein